MSDPLWSLCRREAAQLRKLKTAAITVIAVTTTLVAPFHSCPFSFKTPKYLFFLRDTEYKNSIYDSALQLQISVHEMLKRRQGRQGHPKENKKVLEMNREMQRECLQDYVYSWHPLIQSLSPYIIL